MTWLGLSWDEGSYFQAQRVDLHRQMVQKLIDEKKAYYCTCTSEELEAKEKTRHWLKVVNQNTTAPAGIRIYQNHLTALSGSVALRPGSRLSKI